MFCFSAGSSLFYLHAHFVSAYQPGPDSQMFLDLLHLRPVLTSALSASTAALSAISAGPVGAITPAQGMLDQLGSTQGHVLAKYGPTGHGGRRTLACTLALTVLPPCWEQALEWPATYLSCGKVAVVY